MGALAILLPGFLDGPDLPSTQALRTDLTEAGFHTRTLAAWTGRDPAGYLTSAHLADVHGALDGADGRVVLVGFCYGAHLAVLAADDRVTDVVVLMPTRQFLWPERYHAARDTWGTTKDFDDAALPRSVLDDALRFDADLARKRLTQRVLFLGGDRDEVIRPDLVRALHDECGSPDKTLRILPGVQHDYRDHPDQIAQVDAAVLEWLGRS
jgi:dienelactone hydrolase